ncbi:hypothetical protein L1987_10211 [Smallanthus sonchifolius]|uniref:Uncharacterized protein n=1 Tax=Smallanthus sonchifolius TaxID=185202 RepID=A0ACB9JRG4_9ASTR|nr:hypothetical protein L1987_10211 [Smallanthus sonchifolius]
MEKAEVKGDVRRMRDGEEEQQDGQPDLEEQQIRKLANRTGEAGTPPPPSPVPDRTCVIKMGELAAEEHAKYILTVEKKKDDVESVLMEHLRINGVYWGLTTLDIWPGAELHTGQIFCCIGALAITGCLHYVDKDLLGWWLCERQVKSGGLNGRPEKLSDVCYSWWVLSSLIMIDRVHWIDKEKLVKFILDCQDKENGGISDRPDDAVDVFHTYFGIAGLSLLEYPRLKAIDPAYALPVDVVNRIFLN